MKKALISPIQNNRIAQVAAADFPIAAPLYWVDCPDDCTTEWRFDGLDFAAPAGPSLDDLKARKRAAINQERDTRETHGFEFNGKLFDSDQRSTDRIQVAALAAQTSLMAGQTFSIDWTAADNTVVTLDAQGVLAMTASFAIYGATLHAVAKNLKEQVDAAETAEELEAIVWPA